MFDMNTHVHERADQAAVCKDAAVPVTSSDNPHCSLVLRSFARPHVQVKMSEYNTLKGQMSAIARKAGGSLAVRDISGLVKPQDLVDSENLMTLFVVISKFALKDWEASYETMSNFVVPRSAKVVAEDNDYALVSVVLFKRVLDDFKQAARAKGYQVREYVAPRAEEQNSTVSAEQLRRDVDAKKAALEQWCRTAFGEVRGGSAGQCSRRIAGIEAAPVQG
jgi:V-type H+-transporting ATPase subunit C